jgi:hypothetical protein
MYVLKNGQLSLMDGQFSLGVYWKGVITYMPINKRNMKLLDRHRPAIN